MQILGSSISVAPRYQSGVTELPDGGGILLLGTTTCRIDSCFIDLSTPAPGWVGVALAIKLGNSTNSSSSQASSNSTAASGRRMLQSGCQGQKKAVAVEVVGTRIVAPVWASATDYPLWADSMEGLNFSCGTSSNKSSNGSSPALPPLPPPSPGTGEIPPGSTRRALQQPDTACNSSATTKSASAAPDLSACLVDSTGKPLAEDSAFLQQTLLLPATSLAVGDFQVQGDGSPGYFKGSPDSFVPAVLRTDGTTFNITVQLLGDNGKVVKGGSLPKL